MGHLGGMGCLNLEGLWTRYDDPDVLFEEIAELPNEKATRRMQEIYAEPIKEELIGRRIREIKDAGVIACASLTQVVVNGSNDGERIQGSGLDAAAWCRGRTGGRRAASPAPQRHRADPRRPADTAHTNPRSPVPTAAESRAGPPRDRRTEVRHEPGGRSGGQRALRPDAPKAPQRRSESPTRPPARRSEPGTTYQQKDRNVPPPGG